MRLKLLLVMYVDDFKLAGLQGALAKGWTTIKRRVDIGAPEPFDRYFGCLHCEHLNVKLPACAHQFGHVFEPTKAAACQHRTQDHCHHDTETKTWTRVRLQPHKKSYDPKGDGLQFSAALQDQRYVFFDEPVCLAIKSRARKPAAMPNHQKKCRHSGMATRMSLKRNLRVRGSQLRRDPPCASQQNAPRSAS